MSFKIEVAGRFEKELKHLAKKYPSLKKEYAELIQSLESEPIQGTAIGNNCYKVRLAIASKGKGKSGGARVITHIYVSGKTVYLLSIYDKSEQSTVSEKEMIELVKAIQK
jgi:mRNA-degrading endonuclease RelE of RelBE toxin-antitoxin system